MATIEVSDDQKNVFEGLSKENNMNVGDFLLKCVKTVRLIQKEWDDNNIKDAEEIKNTLIPPQ
jgi:hypothetical protein